MMHRPNPNAGAPLLALLAACAALAATQAHAEAEAGSPKWAAEQLKAVGLKPAPGAHGYVAAARVRGQAQRAAQVVAMLPGADPMLARDYVLISARLDAAGEAAMIETAQAVVAASAHPRRSIVFVLSAEGAERPALPAERMVADLDLDTAAQPAALVLTAADETSLGRDAGEVAAAGGLAVTRVAADPQGYAARSAGVPTLSIGAAPAGVGAYIAALVQRIAGRDARPEWTPGSRYAPPAPRAEEVLTDPVNMPLGHRPQPSVEAFG